MRLNQLPAILGLTTVAVFSTQLAVQANTATYQIGSGTTSLSLDVNLLESLGLSFSSATIPLPQQLDLTLALVSFLLVQI
jgi:hypothetical protein